MCGLCYYDVGVIASYCSRLHRGITVLFTWSTRQSLVRYLVRAEDTCTRSLQNFELLSYRVAELLMNNLVYVSPEELQKRYTIANF